MILGIAAVYLLITLFVFVDRVWEWRADKLFPSTERDAPKHARQALMAPIWPFWLFIGAAALLRDARKEQR